MIYKKIITVSKDLNKFLIKDQKRIKDAIIQLNKYGKRILFVVDKDNSAMGSLSDGDIRKGLLKGLQLGDKLNLVVNKKFIFIKNKNSLKSKLKNIKRDNITFIPVCDVKKKIKEVIDLRKTTEINEKKFPFLILAGGKGVRMRPLTKNKPKPLLKINNRPILEHIILNAKRQGFDQFIISIGYQGKKIKDYFKDGSKLGVTIDYISENKPLGTAGFLGMLRLKDKKMIVSNGDIISKINFKNLINFHDENKSFATMAIRKKLNNETFGVVETKGKKFINVKEKPLITYNINSGIYILSTKAIKLVKKNKKIEMTDLFNLMRTLKKRVYVFPVYENWIDLATIDDLSEANKFFKKYNY